MKKEHGKPSSTTNIPNIADNIVTVLFTEPGVNI
jgi:hypothetical protein